MSVVETIRTGAAVLGLSQRIQQNNSVVGSPATNAITSICALTFPSFGKLTLETGVLLEGWVSFTTGTSGVTAKLDIRQTGTSGAVINTTGLVTVVATQIYALSIQGLDATPLAAGVWIMALTIGSGAAVSTVSAVQLVATAV